MAFRARLDLKGLSEYLERLAAAGKDVDLIADEALAAGGEVLLEGMKRRVRKDTLHLHDSLVVRPGQEGNYHFVDVGLVGADADTARYGNAQEYGTSSMSAQSYIRAAGDEEGRKVKAVMVQVMREQLGE